MGETYRDRQGREIEDSEVRAEREYRRLERERIEQRQLRFARPPRFTGRDETGRIVTR